MTTDLYQKFGVPPINLPFEDAQRRRLCFRNERSLYTRKCDATGEQIISIYEQNKPYKVYKSDYWYSDKWSPLEYGRDFDFSRPFFDQFAELQLEVPRLALSNINGVNSDYCNMTYRNKNCYLIFGGDYNEDCMYGTLCMHNKNTLDNDYGNQNELCYEICDVINSYACQFAFDSKNCNNCYFISDCSGCTECILCTNLVQKSYCIENEQLTKEEYFEKKQSLFQDYEKLFKKFLSLRENRVVKYSHMINCQNCTGDYLKNSKNCINCYDTWDSEDLTNVVFSTKSKDCFECGLIGHGSELCFNIQSTFGAYDSKCSFFIIDSTGVEYSEFIANSHDIFGCIGLRHEEFCILNKKYPEEEYRKLRTRIIEHMKKTGEWGQFFPQKLSCFGYNLTSAYEYFPLTREEALAQGYKWKDEEEDQQMMESKDAIKCEGCSKQFRILEQEMRFYNKMNIPTPGLCSDCRHKRRMNLRNPRKLWSHTCTKCGAPIQTTYSEDRPETVYCEKCYLETVY